MVTILSRTQSNVRISRESSSATLRELRIRKPFADGLCHPRFFFGPQQAAVDASFDCIQQFEPILQRRVLYPLPLIEAPFASKKEPIPAHVLDIDLDRSLVLPDSFPTDFCFGHFLFLLLP